MVEVVGVVGLVVSGLLLLVIGSEVVAVLCGGFTLAAIVVCSFIIIVVISVTVADGVVEPWVVIPSPDENSVAVVASSDEED